MSISNLMPDKIITPIDIKNIDLNVIDVIPVQVQVEMAKHWKNKDRSKIKDYKNLLKLAIGHLAHLTKEQLDIYQNTPKQSKTFQVYTLSTIN